MDRIHPEEIKASLLQKAALALLGIFLSLFLLEMGLRFSGAYLRSVQESRNESALKQKSAYRIMCIGESNTQNQYPRFLPDILNKNRPGIKFTVIDKGLAATNSSLILSQLEANIKKYSPDMVVAMVGINDGGAHMPAAFNSPSRTLFTSMKLYSVMRLICLRVQSWISKYVNTQGQNTGIQPTLSSDKVPASRAEEWGRFYTVLGRRLSIQGRMPLARLAYKKAIGINPFAEEPYYRLAAISDQKEARRIYKWIFDAYKKRAEAKDFKPYRDSQLRQFGSTFATGKYNDLVDLKEVENLFIKILAKEPGNIEPHIALGVIYLTQGRLAEAEEMFKKAIALNSKDSLAFDHLAALYHDTARDDLSERYLRMANSLRNDRSMPMVTINNYRMIKKISDAHKIKLVCVQYPLRSVKYLKEIFPEEPDMVFIDNEQVFKKALRGRTYKYLFKDMSAGDFGHCTDAGNRLLAGNIAAGILKEVFHQP